MHQWAVQVRADELGAHLIAYANTLPVVNTLRLCSRFGTGRQCHVNKLPVELIDAIEEHIKEVARQAALGDWTKQLRCWEDKCGRIADDFTQEEQCEMYHDIYGCRISKDCSLGECDCEDQHECDHRCPVTANDDQRDEYVRELLGQCEFDSFDLHDSNVDALEFNINGLQREVGYFQNERRLLNEHFGIIVWVKNYRYRQRDHSESSRTILAYLTLPDSVIRKDEWEDCCDTGPLPNESSHGILAGGSSSNTEVSSEIPSSHEDSPRYIWVT